MNDSTKTDKCSFRATIMTKQFNCEKASEITRREGPDIACQSGEASSQCAIIFNNLKHLALPELGFEDDLLSMPASVVQKIQFGGLLGLQQTVSGESDLESVDNIYSLVTSVIHEYGGLEELPYNRCLGAIISYKMKKRRKGR